MKSKLVSIMAVFALVLALGAPAAFAGERDGNEYFMDTFSKLGRSGWNLATSPVSLICETNNELVKGDNNFTDFFAGFGKGVMVTVNRALTSVYEAATFIIPSEPLLDTACQ